MKEKNSEIDIKEEIVEIDTPDGVEIIDVKMIKIHKKRERHHTRKHHVHVEVQTSSGIWPFEGFAEVNGNQVVAVMLARAAHHLKITDVEGWVAKVSGKDIDPTKSYNALGLNGYIEINYGPSAGGGGGA